MGRLRAETSPLNGRLLRVTGIPVVAERFAACALRTDAFERDAGLSESKWAEQGEPIDMALSASKTASALRAASYVEEMVRDVLEDERYSTRTGDVLRTLCFAILNADVGALTELNKRRQGNVVEIPPMAAALGAHAGIGLRGEAGNLEQVFGAWNGSVHPGDDLATDRFAATRRIGRTILQNLFC